MNRALAGYCVHLDTGASVAGRKASNVTRVSNAGMLWADRRDFVRVAGKGNGYFAFNAAIDDAAGVVVGVVFTVCSTRKIGGGNRISHKGSLYVPDGDMSVVFDSQTTVEVRETHSRKLLIHHSGSSIALKEIEKGTHTQKTKQLEKTTAKERYKTADNHIWRCMWQK